MQAAGLLRAVAAGVADVAAYEEAHAGGLQMHHRAVVAAVGAALHFGDVAEPAQLLCAFDGALAEQGHERCVVDIAR